MKKNVAVAIFTLAFVLGPLGISFASAQGGDLSCSITQDGKERKGTCKNTCDTGELGTASGGGGCVKPLHCCYTQEAGAGTTCAGQGGVCTTEEKCAETAKANPNATITKQSTADCKAEDKKTCCILLQEKKPSSPGSPVALQNPLGPGANLFTIVQRVITAFLGMVGALALAVFVYAGVLWMTGGSSDRIQKAQDTMKYAVIGLAMIAFSYVIVTFFLNALTGGITTQQPEAPKPEVATPPAPNP